MSEAVREQIQIGAPPERVWEVVMDPARLDEWVTTHDSLVDPPRGPLEQGASFTQKLKLSGAPFKVRWTVSEVEPPRLALWEGEGPARSVARVRYALSEQDGGTRFEYENEFQLPGGVLGRLGARALSAAGGEREARSSLRNLKRLLESASAEPGAPGGP